LSKEAANSSSRVKSLLLEVSLAIPSYGSEAEDSESAGAQSGAVAGSEYTDADADESDSSDDEFSMSAGGKTIIFEVGEDLL
jgi:hypothetical protein